MNYFDDYYNEPTPEQEQQIHEPVQPKAPKEKKDRKFLRRVGCVLVAVALVAGSCATTAAMMNSYFQREMKALTQQMNDKITAIQKDAGKTVTTGETSSRPLASGEYLTPGQVYEKNVNAVVGIKAEKEGYYDSYGRRVSGYSTGTGFFISEKGYVLTNYHVIDEGTKIIVTTHSDEEYEAEVIGYEENNDLALLKVEGTNFPYAEVGSSSELKVGDQVVAIGNALSTFTSSLTVGYVSGVDRVVDTDGVAMNMIQSDVAINSGNSGGPLFNMKGEVVGITTAKFSGNSASGVGIEGIGFAIPIDDVTGMIEDLVHYGYVTGAYLGVMVLDVDVNAQYYGIPAGAYVESVTADTAAERGGMLAKDIITEIDGYKVASRSDLTRVLRKFKAGDEVNVKVYREGQMITLSIVLDEKPREETQTPNQSQQSQLPQQQMPGADAFQEWYNYFSDYFGG